MIVRTGNISLLVEDVTDAIDNIAALADSYKGYVVSSSSWKEGERLVGFITIRVPAERYNEATMALRDMAVEVTSESSSSTDVTEEYIDLEAKLRNLEVTEEQLLKLMEKATKVEEILSVQRELSNTRGQIEQTKGRMQYLERTSATSLIEVHLEQSKLDVGFYADRRYVKSGQAIRFSPEIAGGFAPYSYEWDFGDGNTSNTVAPVHTYKLSGNYDVTLKVTDDKGNVDSETIDDYIVVLSGWNAGTTASNAWSGFITFGQVLINIIIWIGIFSPAWIIIGGIVYWLVRRRRRKV
jgi:PKD repeat protein